LRIGGAACASDQYGGGLGVEHRGDGGEVEFDAVRSGNNHSSRADTRVQPVREGREAPQEEIKKVMEPEARTARVSIEARIEEEPIVEADIAPAEVKEAVSEIL
jgi:hypothetical protein